MARIKRSFSLSSGTLKPIIVSDFQNASTQHRLFILFYKLTKKAFFLFSTSYFVRGHLRRFVDIKRGEYTTITSLLILFSSLCIETPVLFILSCFFSQQPVCWFLHMFLFHIFLHLKIIITGLFSDIFQLVMKILSIFTFHTFLKFTVI